MKVPSGFTVTLPLVGCVFPVTVMVSPSGSKSFTNTLPSTGVPVSVIAVSSFATGAALSGVPIGNT